MNLNLFEKEPDIMDYLLCDNHKINKDLKRYNYDERPATHVLSLYIRHKISEKRKIECTYLVYCLIEKFNAVHLSLL